jgi:PAS domain S-box-containing protein
MNTSVPLNEEDDILREFCWERSRENILACDAEGRILRVNRALSGSLGWERSELAGRSMSLIIEECISDIVLKGDLSERSERKITLRKKDGMSLRGIISFLGRTEGDSLLCVINILPEWDSDNKDEILRMLTVAVEESPVAVIVTDARGTVEYINPRFTRMTGYGISDIVGYSASILRSREMNPFIYDEISETVLKGGQWRGIIKNRNRNDEIYWESVSVHPIRNGGGITHFIKLSEDITERKNMMDSLIRSYEFIEGVMENTNPIFVIEGDGNFLQVNRRFIDISGYSSSSLIGRPASSVFSAEIMKQINSILARRTDMESTPVHFESEMERKNGECRKISIYFSLLRTAENEKYIVGTLEDITGRKEAEEQISRLSRAIEQSPSCIIITDTMGRIEYVNPKFTDVTGYSASEVMGKTTSILKSGHHDAAYYRRLWDTILAGMEWHGEFHNRRKNGEIYWESASISPFRNQEGRITHFVAVKEDITERKKVEEALRNRNEAMERELQYAQMIIRQILPDSAPRFPGLAVQFRYRPLEAIGGDLFSYIEIDDKHLGVFIGDVSGHGVSAALFLALVKSSIDRLSRQYSLRPVELLQQLNRELYVSMGSYFLTAIYGYLRMKAGYILHFARGGHCPPVLCGASVHPRTGENQG